MDVASCLFISLDDFKLLVVGCNAIVNIGIQVFCADLCFRCSGVFLLGRDQTADHKVTLCV